VIGALVFGTLVQVSDAGWRIAYWVFGGLSVVSGVLIWWLVEEPPRGQSEAALANSTGEIASQLEGRHRFSLQKIPDLLRIPTLWAVWLVGIAERFVWVGVVNFGSTWLADERGLSPGMAVYAVGVLTLGMGLGGLLGGRVGDWLDRWNPGLGRALLGHAAKVLAVITAAVLFAIQWEGTLVHWAFFCLMGFWIAASDNGASVPMSTAVTLPEVRATASAVGATVAGVATAVGSSVIGQLGVQLGLTATLLWVVTGAALAQVLIWVGCYPVYRRDAAKVQRILGERLVELARSGNAQKQSLGSHDAYSHTGV
jgi:predicted MFS family arabinose efflux permease